MQTAGSTSPDDIIGITTYMVLHSIHFATHNVLNDQFQKLSSKCSEHPSSVRYVRSKLDQTSNIVTDNR